jgi:hypothetical protein
VSSARTSSLHAIASVATALGDLRDRVVFVGGAVVALYALEDVSDVRPTVDVDCIVDVATTLEYYALVGALRAAGFAECTDPGAPLCRHVHAGVRVDVMPTSVTAIGPTNRWYADGLRGAVAYDAAGVPVRAITPLHFVATKLDAFANRGGADYGASHDLEDLLTVLAGLPSLRREIDDGVGVVASAVRRELAALMAREAFRDALPGHFDGHAAGQERARRVAAFLRSLSRQP